MVLTLVLCWFSLGGVEKKSGSCTLMSLNDIGCHYLNFHIIFCSDLQYSKPKDIEGSGETSKKAI